MILQIVKQGFNPVNKDEQVNVLGSRNVNIDSNPPRTEYLFRPGPERPSGRGDDGSGG